MLTKTLRITTSPHLKKGMDTPTIMRHVVYALLPVAVFSVFVFGLCAFWVLATTVISCLITEFIINQIAGNHNSLTDSSAIITGLLLGLTLPPIFPLWMAAVGGFIAIALGKMAFGGLGNNVFNPALVARAVLQAAFPVAITTWHPAMLADRFQSLPSSLFTTPFSQPVFDGVSGATPLSAFKFDQVVASANDLAFGFVSGSLGETSAFLILVGGIYLWYRGIINWRVPVGIIATVFLLSGALYLIDATTFAPPQFMVLSGGLMLGAVFMATDMVGSPMTNKGMWIYAVFIGLMVVVIRSWGGLPEGVMYAILLANAISPHIDRMVKDRVYGT